MAPSSSNCARPAWNCLWRPVLRFSMRAKHSGGKRGTGVYWTGSPCAEGVADGEEPRIDQPDHVAGERLLDRLPVLTEEAVRAGEADRPAQARVEDLHVLLEAPGADPQERHPVAVSRVHVRLDLEDEAGEIGIVRRHRTAVALARGPGAGSSSARASRKGPMPKLVSALPNSTGV